ncbi:MAG: hypothetical protein M1829_006480 [Trizodia sp. TS-e1964]|nr:MAG: hypothetical protein M1829_006480 [Trizodia sp. TS-e1964]
MPSYFFHLSFELFPYPDPSGPRSGEETAHETAINYLPPPGTNIFKGNFPSHERYIKQEQQIENKGLPPDPPSKEQRRGVGQGQSLPGQLAPKKAVPKRDWRYNRISIEGIDMSDNTPNTGITNANSNTIIGGVAGSGSNGLATKGRYVPLDPKNTELGWGIIHLYRDGEESSGLLNERISSGLGSKSSSSKKSANKANVKVSDKSTDEDCTTLCILAVPSYLTPSDFLGFVGEQTREEVSHFRMIRTGRTNRYMVLMKFRSPKKAKKWKREWNGRPFNTTEPENCHVVFIKSINFENASHPKSDPSNFPDMTNDPFTPSIASKATSSSLASQGLLKKPFAPPTPSLVELPTCPTERVWDYAGDGYVHRLIQSKSDGKLVDFPSTHPEGNNSITNETKLEDHHHHHHAHKDSTLTLSRDKVESMAMEYTYLLTSQLESQRLYFEEKIAQAADKASQASQSAESAAETALKLSDQLAELQRAHQLLVTDIIPSLEKDKARAERKAEKSTEILRSLQRDCADERAMNESLRERVSLLGKQVEGLRGEKDELLEMNRDLGFFISGQERLRGEGEDVVQGKLELGAAEKGRRKGKGMK